MENITIGNEKVEVRTYETSLSEKNLYGLYVYMFRPTCRMWEYYMPYGSIRDKASRDVSSLCADFIDRSLLSRFVDTLSSETGYTMHIANKSSIPPSVYYERFSQFGLNRFYGDVNNGSIWLIIYSNNR